MSRGAVEVPSRERCLRAALFLSRVLLAQATDGDFDTGDNGIEVAEGGAYICYEGITIAAVDMAGGALMLLRGLIEDVAQLQELEPTDVARTLELYTSATDATFGFHTENWPDDEEQADTGLNGDTGTGS